MTEKRRRKRPEEKEEFKYTVRLSREEAQKLALLAAKRLMSKSEYIRYLILNAKEG